MIKQIEFIIPNDIFSHPMEEADMAYIKQEVLNNNLVWSIYNIQGEKMGYASSREMAFAVATQNEYIGTSVH